MSDERVGYPAGDMSDPNNSAPIPAQVDSTRVVESESTSTGVLDTTVTVPIPPSPVPDSESDRAAVQQRIEDRLNAQEKNVKEQSPNTPPLRAGSEAAGSAPEPENVPLTAEEQKVIDDHNQAHDKAKAEFEKVVDSAGLYRFIGANSSIGAHRLTDYGTQVSITDPQMVVDTVAGGVALVPESVWGRAGFTEDELNEYPDATKVNFETDATFLKKYYATGKAASAFRDACVAYRTAETAAESINRFYTQRQDLRVKRARYEAILREHDPEHPMLGKRVEWFDMVKAPDGKAANVNIRDRHETPGAPFKGPDDSKLIVHGVLS